MSASLVGSEMCIRDSVLAMLAAPAALLVRVAPVLPVVLVVVYFAVGKAGCLLYTSDAADDM
eukprot:8679484-Alexandrium_andersonii.AAC.1